MRLVLKRRRLLGLHGIERWCVSKVSIDQRYEEYSFCQAQFEVVPPRGNPGRRDPGLHRQRTFTGTEPSSFQCRENRGGVAIGFGAPLGTIHQHAQLRTLYPN